MQRFWHSTCWFFVAAGLAAAAGGDPTAFDASPDGDIAPQSTTWSTARSVNALAFPSVGAVGIRSVSDHITVNHDPEGDIPRELAFTADGTAVVIANRDTDTATFFDVATQTITHTVNVGDFPVHVAVTPDNQYAVIPNVFSNDVSVVDIATHTLVANVPITGEQPYRVAVTPDSNFAVIGVINDAVSSAFSIIDLGTLSETASFSSTPQGVIGFFGNTENGITGNIFTQFALSPDGTRIVLPDRGNDRVAIYDRATGSQLALLAVADGPTAVDISLDNTLAVVSHETNPGAISTIDLTTLSVTNSFSTSDWLQGQVIRVTPDKSHAMAAISNNVIFTNLTTGARTATINTGVVGDIELSFDGQYAFVSNFNARVIDIASQSLVKTMPFAACADSATSPTEYRAVSLNNRFREDVQLYNINGASGFFEGFALSGEIPEGDASRDVILSPDGSLAIVCLNTSRNVAIIDMSTRTVRSYVDVGERPLGAAITPDNAYAVVCAADANLVAIIDLTTDTVVRTLSISTRPSRVRISPDGQYAYVLNMAGTDRVTFIQLDGPSSSILSQVASGETGVAYGYAFSEFSGVELTHDGSIFAVCASFDDRLNLFDTATRTQIASVLVGDFPIRVSFSADDTRAYVANSFGDSVSVVDINGGGSSLIATVGGVDFPLSVEPDESNTYVYVGNAGTSAGIRVLDTSSNTFVKTVLFASGYPRDAYLSWTDDTLYVAGWDYELVRVSAAGLSSALIDSTPLLSIPSDMAFDNTLGVALFALPGPDGIDTVQFGCATDVDSDRDTDLADLAQLLGNYGMTGGATHADGDVDGDGDVDLADLAALISAYGTNCP